jgi:hypothetical protein
MKSLLCALLVAAATANAAEPLLTAKPPQEAFIDDPFALRADGKAVAWIATDGASSAWLHLSEIGAAEKVVPNLPATPVAVHWLAPARVLVVWRDPRTSALLAKAWSLAGAENERLGPADQIELATVDGKPAVVTYARVDKGKSVEHQFTAYRADTLKPLAKKSLREDKEGSIPFAGGGLRPLWTEHGLTTLAVRRSGEYDKAKDMQRPDRLARLDVFTGKLRDEQEIGDVLAFVHVNADHGKHPGEATFAHVTDDRQKLVLVDGNEEHELGLSRALSMYEPETLRFQTLDDGRFALSLTVDPMNPPAQLRKHADPAELDLYIVDARARAATLRFRFDIGDRPAAWQVAGNRVALLRKSRGFNRGGVQIELYDLNP